MAPSMAEWRTEITPPVFITLILLILIVDIPLLIGILRSKHNRSSVTNMALVNFIFVSFLAIGLMAATAHHGLWLYPDGKLLYNCDVFVVAYNILEVAAPTALLTVIIARTAVVSFVPFIAPKSPFAKKNPMEDTVRNIMKICCVVTPWAYALGLILPVVDFRNNVNLQDCDVGITAMETHILWNMGYFLPAAFAMLFCIISIVFYLAIPYDSRKPSVLPYVAAEIIAFGLMFATVYINTTECVNMAGWPGCYLSIADSRDHGQPASIASAISFLMFPLILMFSKPIRQIYLSFWAPCLRFANYEDDSADGGSVRDKFGRIYGRRTEQFAIPAEDYYSTDRVPANRATYISKNNPVGDGGTRLKAIADKPFGAPTQPIKLSKKGHFYVKK